MNTLKDKRDIGEGEKCPKCSVVMVRRRHIKKPKTDNFFTEWDWCKSCRHLQHYEKFRVPKEKWVDSLEK